MHLKTELNLTVFEVLSDFMASSQVLWKDLCRVCAHVYAYCFPSSGFIQIFSYGIVQILQDEDDVTVFFFLFYFNGASP